MRLIVTGGGTGGHIYPALEVARAARDRGDEVKYFGSFRGQESRIAEREGFTFTAFPSEPLFRPASMRGIRAMVNLMRATGMAARALDDARPDVLLSTGGYSSAPVTAAARRRGIPYVIHEQNMVPGRTNRILAKKARAVAVVFRGGGQGFPGIATERTGMPIRRELRTAQGSLGIGAELANGGPLVLVMGGSQGSQAINEVALAAAVRMARVPIRWLHLAGISHYEAMMDTARRMGLGPDYVLRAYLEADEMASALFAAEIAVCRSGAGTLAELAAFRRPSVLVPYPHAFGDHQRANAREFVEIGAAEVLEQSDLDATRLEARLRLWVDDRERQVAAARALAEWDIPDATERLLALLDRALPAARATNHSGGRA